MYLFIWNFPYEPSLPKRDVKRITFISGSNGSIIEIVIFDTTEKARKYKTGQDISRSQAASIMKYWNILA